MYKKIILMSTLVGGITLPMLPGQAQARVPVVAPAAVELAHTAVVQMEYSSVDDHLEQIIVSTAPHHARINAYEITLQYDPALHDVVAVLPAGKLCEERFLIERTVDEISGVIYLACGTITPPPANEDLGLVSVVFKKRTGSPAVLQLQETNSALYQSDGKGTRVPIVSLT